MSGALFLDFETRCRFDLRKTGAHRYLQEPSCSILLTGWAIDDGPIRIDRGVSDDFLRALQSADRVVVHNAGFERLVVKYLLGLEFPPSRWDCTSSRARAAGLPSALDDVAEALELGVRKDKRGKMLIRKLCAPQKNGTFNEDPALMLEFAEYNRRDVEVLRLLDAAIPPLCNWERPIFEYDFVINDRGVGVDLKLLEACQKLADIELQRIDAELAELTDGTVTTVGQRARILAALEANGCQAKDLKKDSVGELLRNGAQLTPKARRLLELRRDGARTSLGKLSALEERQTGGRLKGSLLYHGTHPGRHTSTGAQLQNLPRPERKAWMIRMGIEDILGGDWGLLSMLYGSPIGLIADAIRSLLVPAEGHVLETADYNAIELRGAAWLAGETRVLDALRVGVDLYCVAASAAYGRKIVPTMEDERFLGKTLMLAGQYGMGVVRFMTTCRAQGLEVSEALAQRSIATYRDNHPRIIAYWYALERAARKAIDAPGLKVRAGRVTFVVEGDWMLLWLPSGRAIRYYKPEIDADGSLVYHGVNSRTHQFGPIRVWGSLLLENATQALCRDILMTGCADLEVAGRKAVLLVHDEVVCETAHERADIDEVCGVLETPPVWAPGLPLKVKGAVLSERYMKI
jgi:DNA polymerase